MLDLVSSVRASGWVFFRAFNQRVVSVIEDIVPKWRVMVEEDRKSGHS
jgi:hypothetical protein